MEICGIEGPWKDCGEMRMMIGGWRVQGVSADQNMPLVGVVFSVFLLQNQKQFLKQEHVPLSSLLPHLTHPLQPGNVTMATKQLVWNPYTQLTTPPHTCMKYAYTCTVYTM